jgi:predicted Zn-dependent protease
MLTREFEEKMGHENYESLVQSFEKTMLPQSHAEYIRIRSIVDRILLANGIPGEWTLTVVDTDEPNCFVLPGRHIFVLRGIYALTNFPASDDGLAFVMGHEIAHVLAHHAANKMSLNFAMIAVKIVIATLLNLPYDLTNAGTTIMLELPNSRSLESEADQIGLLFLFICWSCCLSVGLAICLCVYLPLCLRVCLCVCMSIRVSVRMSVRVSVSLKRCSLPLLSHVIPGLTLASRACFQPAASVETMQEMSKLPGTFRLLSTHPVGADRVSRLKVLACMQVCLSHPPQRGSKDRPNRSTKAANAASCTSLTARGLPFLGAPDDRPWIDDVAE